MMKKTSWLLGLLLAAVLLTGCGSAAEQDTAPAENTPPPVLRSPAAAGLTYRVENVPYTGSTSSEAGVQVASYRIQRPTMTVYDKNGRLVEEGRTVPEKQALETAKTFNDRFACWVDKEELEQFVQAAKEEQAAWQERGEDWFAAHFQELDCTLYQTDKLVSVSGLCLNYTGGAHPNSWRLGWNFDLETGRFLSPDVVTEDAEGYHLAVKEELIRQAQTAAGEQGMTPEEFFWPNYQEILGDWVNYAVSFDETGMTVAFSPYELASYAAGEQVFAVPYPVIRPWLSPHGLVLLGLDGE